MYTPANSLDEQQNEDSNKATLIQVDRNNQCEEYSIYSENALVTMNRKEHDVVADCSGRGNTTNCIG